MATDQFDSDSALLGGDNLPMEVRRDHIARLARRRSFVSVGEVSRLFQVSEVTVRNDFQSLEAQGRLRRVRGGAVTTFRPVVHPERPFVQSLGRNADEKQQIGKLAAGLVRPGETLILDVGTTTTAVAQELAARGDLTDVTVFTNGLTIALALEPGIPRLSVVVTGGTLRPLQHSLVDPLGDLVLDRINVDTVFLGCNGVHPIDGVTNVNLPEAAMKRRMLRAARRRIVVADGSKIGATSLAPLCRIEDVDVLVTGLSAHPDALSRLSDLALEVRVAQ